MKFSANYKIFLLLPGLVLLTCGVGCDEPNVGLISGIVTIDDKPVKEGSIAFFPIDGKSVTAGGVIADGKYAAKVPLGKLRVEIRVAKVVGEKKLYDAPNSPVQPLLAELLPARYNDRSELKIAVEPGRSEHDFALTAD